jgi:hypothetical protein
MTCFVSLRIRSREPTLMKRMSRVSTAAEA